MRHLLWLLWMPCRLSIAEPKSWRDATSAAGGFRTLQLTDDAEGQDGAFESEAPRGHPRVRSHLCTRANGDHHEAAGAATNLMIEPVARVRTCRGMFGHVWTVCIRMGTDGMGHTVFASRSLSRSRGGEHRVSTCKCFVSMSSRFSARECNYSMRGSGPMMGVGKSTPGCSWLVYSLVACYPCMMCPSFPFQLATHHFDVLRHHAYLRA